MTEVMEVFILIQKVVEFATIILTLIYGIILFGLLTGSTIVDLIHGLMNPLIPNPITPVGKYILWCLEGFE